MEVHNLGAVPVVLEENRGGRAAPGAVLRAGGARAVLGGVPDQYAPILAAAGEEARRIRVLLHAEDGLVVVLVRANATLAQ